MFYDVVKTDIKTSIKMAHSILKITLKLEHEQKRGPGFWKMNVNVLKDEIYIDLIRHKIEQLKLDYINITDHGLKWDLIKSDIRQLTIDYSKTQTRIKRTFGNVQF